jgi:hypothetical protein
MRFDVRSALAALTQIGTGTLTGQIQGEQLQRERQQEDFQRNLSFLQYQHQLEEDRRNAALSGLDRSLPYARQNQIPGIMERRDQVATAPMPSDKNIEVAGINQGYAPRPPSTTPWMSPVSAPTPNAPPPYQPVSPLHPSVSVNPALAQNLPLSAIGLLNAGGITGGPGQPTPVPQMQAPAPPPAQTPKPANVGVVGGFPIQFKGIDKTAAAQMAKDVTGAIKSLRDMPPSPDKNVEAAKNEALSNLPTDFSDEDAYARGQRLVQLAAQLSPGSGAGKTLEPDRKYIKDQINELGGSSPDLAVKVLPDILANEDQLGATAKASGRAFIPIVGASRDDIAAMQRLDQSHDPADKQKAADIAARILERVKKGLTPQAEQAALNGLRIDMDKMGLAQANDPKQVRAAYKRRGVDYLIKDVPDNQLPRYGSARAEREMTDWVMKFRNTTPDNPDARAFILRKVNELSKQAGSDLPVPPELFQSMTPAEKKRFEFQQQKNQTDQAIKREQVRQGRVRLDISLDRLKMQKKQALDKASRLDPLNPTERATFTSLLNKLYAGQRDKYTHKWTPSLPDREREQVLAGVKRLAGKANLPLSAFGLSDDGSPMPAGPGGSGTGQAIKDLASPNRPENKRKPPAQMSDDELKRRLAEKLLGK